jgi:hypothetical protein
MSDIKNLRIWEKCAPCPIDSTPDSFFIQSNANINKNCLYVTGNNSVYNYSAVTDGWTKIADPNLGGTFGPGSCGVYHPKSFTAVAQAGSGGSIWPDPYAGGNDGASFVTNLNILTNLRAKDPYSELSIENVFYGIIQSGVDKGKIVSIVGNTTGFNSIIYLILSGQNVPNIEPGTVIDFYTGRYYVFNAGTLNNNSFKYFDYATQTWSTGLSVTNLPATWSSSGSMEVFTNGYTDLFVTGGDGSTSTQITNPYALYPVNAFIGLVAIGNYDVLYGEKRLVISNTSTSITVSPAFSSSTLGIGFSLIGNEDIIYLTGNGGDALYSYSISSNLWTFINTATSRWGNHSKASNLNWIACPKTVNSDNSTKYRKILSFRCDNTNLLDSYDFPSKEWVEDIYGGNEIFTNSSSFAMGQTIDNKIIYCQINPVIGENPRFVGYDIDKKALVGYGSIPSILNTIIDGKRLFVLESDTKRTTTNKKYLYYLMPSSKKMFRAEVD